MFAFQPLTAVLAFFAIGIQASPLSRRDVIVPKITSPTKDSVWPVGSTQTVTWDTSNFPPVSQITNILGKVILGFDENDSLNLDFDHPLAQNFNLTDGSVKVTVPSVTPRSDYLIVLFGDSGNTSPAFSITRISASDVVGSSSASSTETLITTPIPITGSVITGGDSSTGAPTTTDGSASTTPTDSGSAPVTTATTPSTSLPSSVTGSATTAAASSSTTTTKSSGWSIREPSTMSFKALSVCIAAAITLVMI